VLFSVSAKPGHDHAKTTIMEKQAGRMRHRSNTEYSTLGGGQVKSSDRAIPPVSPGRCPNKSR
jgi:hypothetical protein